MVEHPEILHPIERVGTIGNVEDADRLAGFDVVAVVLELEEDLYEDVRPALTTLRTDGIWLGIAGNQTIRSGKILRELLADDVDSIGTSDDWGASKPDPAFFHRVAEVVPFSKDEILYVGDRIDNDIRTATAAGMHSALVHRGPRATIQWRSVEAERLPTFRVEGLGELSGLIKSFNDSTG
ncbi:HAD family hydrolase [Streptomyces sp. NPDC002078]